MNSLMCEDLEAAKLNRERIEREETNRFYDMQSHAVA